MNSGGYGIAFLGMGLMGQPMAARLCKAGYKLTVWNRSAEKAQPLKDVGAEVAIEPYLAIQGAEYIMLCLTNGDAVEEVIFGNGGLYGSLYAGQTIIDFSSISPHTTRAIAGQLLTERHVNWVDAPVSGGVKGAVSGTLVIMAGGEAEHINAARPVLSHLSQKVTYMGAVGAGQAAKLCNQLIVSTNMLAIAEAMALGRAQGVNVDSLPDAFAGGFADSVPLQIFGPRMACQQHEPILGAIDIMRKDVNTIEQALKDQDIAFPLLVAVKALYEKASVNGLGPADLSALMKLYI
ncbi:NAD(P)-dependent oxidoreductase [Kordiimonas pumila]|uniref:NAD(P)-dependent oxidoreductase n=1 Tax=Kordiimonas pumila TaxID=2161677 RepID=A0ABV7D4P4_9PROT|nr:NAD(P)-dependent oxidoreductase [Kordiimonas pumila]